MPVILRLERRPFGFIAANGADREQLSIFPIGAIVDATIVRSKSGPMLRYYWKLIELVGDGVGIGKRPLSDEMLIRTGNCDKLIFKNGEIHLKPRSIADMDHGDFKEFFDAAFDLICREYIAKGAGNDLLRQAAMMTGITYEQAFARGTPK